MSNLLHNIPNNLNRFLGYCVVNYGALYIYSLIHHQTFHFWIKYLMDTQIKKTIVEY